MPRTSSKSKGTLGAVPPAGTSHRVALRLVATGKYTHTSGNLYAKDIQLYKGRYVSKKQHANAMARMKADPKTGKKMPLFGGKRAPLFKKGHKGPSKKKTTQRKKTTKPKKTTQPKKKTTQRKKATKPKKTIRRKKPCRAWQNRDEVTKRCVGTAPDSVRDANGRVPCKWSRQRRNPKTGHCISKSRSQSRSSSR